MTQAETKIFQPLVQFPNGSNGQVWARLMSGARNSMHMGPYSTTLSGALAERKQSVQDLNWRSDTCCWKLQWSLIPGKYFYQILFLAEYSQNIG